MHLSKNMTYLMLGQINSVTNLNELSKALNISGYWDMVGAGLYVGHITHSENKADLGLMAVFENPSLEPLIIFEDYEAIPYWKIEKAKQLIKVYKSLVFHL